MNRLTVIGGVMLSCRTAYSGKAEIALRRQPLALVGGLAVPRDCLCDSPAGRLRSLPAYMKPRLACERTSPWSADLRCINGRPAPWPLLQYM